MKWLQEVWNLFVDDPRLALMALVALAVGLILVRVGIKEASGLVIFLVVAGSLWYSIRSD